MSKIAAWSLFFLGVAHIAFGIVRFKTPLAAALAAGFFNQFYDPELRRTAFWFIMVGPLLVLVGHIAIRAVAANDHALLTVIGTYAIVASVIGIAAFPKSPLWLLFVVALALIYAGTSRSGSGTEAAHADLPIYRPESTMKK